MVIVAKITVVMKERFSSRAMTAVTRPAARGSMVSCCPAAKACTATKAESMARGMKLLIDLIVLFSRSFCGARKPASLSR